MAAMFRNGSGWLIFPDRFLLMCAIWLWMYMRNVMDVHRPIFMMVESSTPCSFSAIAPPALRE